MWDTWSLGAILGGLQFGKLFGRQSQLRLSRGSSSPALTSSKVQKFKSSKVQKREHLQQNSKLTQWLVKTFWNHFPLNYFNDCLGKYKYKSHKLGQVSSTNQPIDAENNHIAIHISRSNWINSILNIFQTWPNSFTMLHPSTSDFDHISHQHNLQKRLGKTWLEQ